METFRPPVHPSFNSTKSVQPRILKARFGDGYNQRVADGLNALPQTWDLRWNTLTAAQVDEIEAFLTVTAGYKAFLWTPLDRTQPLKFIVESWTRTPVDGRSWSFSAKFSEVFDL